MFERANFGVISSLAINWDWRGSLLEFPLTKPRRAKKEALYRGSRPTIFALRSVHEYNLKSRDDKYCSMIDDNYYQTETSFSTNLKLLLPSSICRVSLSDGLISSYRLVVTKDDVFE